MEEVEGRLRLGWEANIYIHLYIVRAVHTTFLGKRYSE